MIKPVIRSHLTAVLAAHGVTTYRLAKSIKETYGEASVSQPTVYAVASNKGMPDTKTLNQIITVLRELTGKPLQVGDLFEYEPD